MKYVVHCWRYYQKHEFEFPTLKEALRFAKAGTDAGECYVEKVTDDDGKVIIDYEKWLFTGKWK